MLLTNHRQVSVHTKKFSYPPSHTTFSLHFYLTFTSISVTFTITERLIIMATPPSSYPRPPIPTSHLVTPRDTQSERPSIDTWSQAYRHLISNSPTPGAPHENETAVDEDPFYASPKPRHAQAKESRFRKFIRRFSQTKDKEAKRTDEPTKGTTNINEFMTTSNIRFQSRGTQPEDAYFSGETSSPTRIIDPTPPRAHQSFFDKLRHKEEKKHGEEPLLPPMPVKPSRGLIADDLPQIPKEPRSFVPPPRPANVPPASGFSREPSYGSVYDGPLYVDPSVRRIVTPTQHKLWTYEPGVSSSAQGTPRSARRASSSPGGERADQLAATYRRELYGQMEEEE